MTTRRAPETCPPAELVHFETILLKRRKFLLEDAAALEREEEGTAEEIAGRSLHAADFGTDRSAHDVSLACRESVTNEIQEIDDAL